MEKVNAAGRELDLRSIVALECDELIATAMQNTGLFDFGVNQWRKPFQVLVDGREKGADLDLSGCPRESEA